MKFQILWLVGLAILSSSVSAHKRDPAAPSQYHFTLEGDYCPVGFSQSMLRLFNEQRKRDSLPELKLSQVASSIAEDVAFDKQCRYYSGESCIRGLSYAYDYGQISLDLSLKEGVAFSNVSFTGESIMADARVKGSLPTPLYLMDREVALSRRFTKDEWKSATVLGVGCLPNKRQHKVALVFVFNGGRGPKKSLRGGTSGEFVFPFPRETCPDGFKEAMVAEINRYRSMDSSLKHQTLQLNEDLSRKASWISTYNRCERCASLLEGYVAHGQAFFLKRINDKVDQVTATVSEIGSGTLKTKRPWIVFDAQNWHKYTRQEWAASSRIGVGCATYSMPKKGGHTVSWLMVFFTFDKP